LNQFNCLLRIGQLDSEGIIACSCSITTAKSFSS
jgi:hypothetical protein